MKIVMLGRGVISTQYAWAFEQAGHTVDFYVRPGKKAELGGSISLNLVDARKKRLGIDVHQKWKINLIEELSAPHPYDLIFVSVQHYQIRSVVDFLKDKIAQATVLIFNNFWEEPLEVLKGLPFPQLVFGFPMAGGGFDDKGVLNGTLMGSVKIGLFDQTFSSRTHEVIQLFQSAQIKAKISPDFRAFLLGHFVFDAAFALERIKYSNPDDFIKALKTSDYWRNVIANGKELMPLLKERMVTLANSSDLKLFRLPPWFIALIMKFVLRFLPPLRKVLTSHTNTIEMKAYCKDVWQSGQALKIELPRFEQYKNMFQK